MAIKIAADRRRFGSSGLNAAGLRHLRDETLTGLVDDVVVVLEARRLRLAPARGNALSFVTEHPGLVRGLYERLYALAARRVSVPRNAHIRSALAERIDPEYIGTLLTPKERPLYNRWQAARDRTATAWFRSLFRRYAKRTQYAPGFRPAPVQARPARN
jgi:hypothetical protein